MAYWYSTVLLRGGTQGLLQEIRALQSRAEAAPILLHSNCGVRDVHHMSRLHGRHDAFARSRF